VNKVAAARSRRTYCNARVNIAWSITCAFINVYKNLLNVLKLKIKAVYNAEI
jgi:hypothetical protein